MKIKSFKIQIGLTNLRHMSWKHKIWYLVLHITNI